MMAWATLPAPVGGQTAEQIVKCVGLLQLY
jgi:hypothetical protein